MKKIFTIQFDNTIASWDSKTNTFIPRQHTVKFINTLCKLGAVSLYSDTSMYLVETFLCDIYNRISMYDIPSNLYTSISPYMIQSENDILDISSVHKMVYGKVVDKKYSTLMVVPPTLSKDAELLTLSKYLKKKVIDDVKFSDTLFDDWNDRVELITRNKKGA